VEGLGVNSSEIERALDLELGIIGSISKFYKSSDLG